MTRFARAKGSKSSNEKTPEEATSWSEMKKAILQRSSTSSHKSVGEVPKSACVDVIKKGPVEWAPLDNDTVENNFTLIRQHHKKFSVVDSQKEKKTSEKNKNTENSVNENNLQTAEINGTRKVKKKKKNKKENLEVNSEMGNENIQSDITIQKNENIKKEMKKRKLNVTSPEEPLQKKSKIKDVSQMKTKKAEKKRVSNEVNREKDVSNDMMTNFVGSNGSLQQDPLDENEASSIKSKKKFKNQNVDLVKSKKKNTSKEKGKKDNMKNKQLGKNNKKKQLSKNNVNQNENSRFDVKKSSKFKKKANPVEELIVNGEKIKVVKFQGFCVMSDDAERLKKLKADMLKEGIPRQKLEAALKLERRRAEKALARIKKAVCFHCRGMGHNLSECPSLTESQNTGTGICYKCGSTEHSALECKVVRGSNFQYAECFICKEQGHIARQCPDNPRGLYPHGGACRECGDVTHLRKDCPKAVSKKEEQTMTVGFRSDRNLESLEEETLQKEKNINKGNMKKKPVVKF